MRECILMRNVVESLDRKAEVQIEFRIDVWRAERSYFCKREKGSKVYDTIDEIWNAKERKKIYFSPIRFAQKSCSLNRNENYFVCRFKKVLK